MAQLFKKNIILEKLENFEIPDFEKKIEILESWNNLYKQGKLHEKKETSIQGEFASHILGSVLGYKDFVENNDEWNRQNEPGNPTGGQSSDFGLGYFKSSKDFSQNLIKVVVEVKDTKTSLDKPQQRAGNLTPVQQAFKYKPYFNECDFIIVSNFYETRLYIDSYYDYETFTLSDLVDPKNNYFNFRKFYYLLGKENLITKSGDSNTKSLLSLIRIREKEITKDFYKEYTNLRKELFKNIVANNPGFKKSELDFLLNKTQKIIDRTIFIHFCEDLGLLPQGKLKENLLRAEEIGFTPWEMLQKFFEFVNSGSEKLGIPDGYNGGLFKEDIELNKLKVGNDICKKFVDLGDYDFADDLSVNILGHIFEQSISDIEELKDKINKQEEVTLSKRKKDGVFYTPEYIVDYIVKNSVGKKIDEREDELKIKHNLKDDITDKNYEKRAILVYGELQTKVQNIKVLDPACGSGAFLVKVFDFLLDKNKEISKKLEDLGVNQGLFSGESYFKTILQNNIYGVDLNEESVEITKLSLWLKTAQKGKKLANLDSNIKCGNSLIDDKEIAGDKAFKWESEFSEILKTGRIFIDRNIQKIGNKSDLLDLLHKYRLKPFSFNIDGRFNENNPSEGDIIDWYKDNKTPYKSSIPGKGIIELEPTFIGTNFDNIAIRKNSDPSYLLNGIIKGSGGIPLNIKGGDNILKQYLEIFEDILGKDLINKHINDFLILLNSISQKQIESYTFCHTEKGFIQSVKMIEKIIIQYFITDDISGIFTQTNRDKIFNKFGYKILKSNELEKHLDESNKEIANALGGFDVIVGNPPYVNIKGMDVISRDFFFSKGKYVSATYKTDLYALFTEKGLSLLNNKGYLGFIMPYSWLSSSSFESLRKFILDGFSILELDIFGLGVFEDANILTAISIIKKSNIKSNIKLNDFRDIKISDIPLYLNGTEKQSIIDIDFIIKSSDSSIPIDIKLDDISIISKVDKNKNSIFDFDVDLGMNTADDNKFIFSSNNGLLNPKKVIEGKNFGRYYLNWTCSYVEYLPDKMKTNKITARPGTEERFETTKIILYRFIDKSNRLIATFDNNNYYTLGSTYVIGGEPNKLKALLLLLNSSLIGFYISRVFSGSKITKNELEKLPLNISEQTSFIEKADFMLDKNKELQEKVNKFLNRLKSSFGIEKFSNKLEGFYNLSFADFVKELAKNKVNLSLKDQDEWDDYFDSYKKEILELKSRIDSCDKEIDEMVFDLYELSEEERKVVLGGN